MMMMRDGVYESTPLYSLDMAEYTILYVYTRLCDAYSLVRSVSRSFVHLRGCVCVLLCYWRHSAIWISVQSVCTLQSSDCTTLLFA